MKARVVKQSGQMRKFKVPAKLNFDATKYFEMIGWTNVVITAPPLNKTMTDADLGQFIAMQVNPTVIFPKFLCHTQTVERVLKLVIRLWTESTRRFHRCSYTDGSDGALFRQLIPIFETKCDYTHFALYF